MLLAVVRIIVVILECIPFWMSAKLGIFLIGLKINYVLFTKVLQIPEAPNEQIIRNRH